jgi:hypothetical protein
MVERDRMLTGFSGDGANAAPSHRPVSATINMPTLSVLIDPRERRAPNLHESQLIELQGQGIEITPAIVSVIAQRDRRSHPVTIMHLDRRLAPSGTSQSPVAARQGHKLLPELARIQASRLAAWRPNDLTDDTVNRGSAIRLLRIKPEKGLALDYCARAGLLAC